MDRTEGSVVLVWTSCAGVERVGDCAEAIVGVVVGFVVGEVAVFFGAWAQEERLNSALTINIMEAKRGMGIPWRWLLISVGLFLQVLLNLQRVICRTGIVLSRSPKGSFMSSWNVARRP